MPVTFRSRADVAPSTRGFEASRDVEKDFVEALRARARSRRELVKSSWVDVWASKSVVLEVDLGANGLICDDDVVPFEVVVDSGAVDDGSRRRERRVEVCVALAGGT